MVTIGMTPLRPVSFDIPKPSKAQLAWHKLETYAFVHFGPNTFTNREWGEGKEDPKVFAPTQLDTRQWARVAKAAGMKGIILTAKHHDGFCLWPSKYSKHTVRESGWKGGKGDVLRELSEACKEYGLKLGVYLSPWDRNHPAYGTPEYNQIFANTLTEVLTQYGPVFEVWFDGANGEGPNGKKQVYDWKLFVSTVRKHQPNAVIFSDAGPDIRWVGNEDGVASETNWTTLKADELTPGTSRYKELPVGHPDGKFYVPAEADVSIRPGWFYHPEQDDKVRSPENLVELYEKSVGRGANLLLNLPVDRRGLVHENDEKSLIGWRKLLNETYGKKGSSGTVTRAFQSTKVAVTKPFDRVVIAEDLRNGQKVEEFSINIRRGKEWSGLAQGTTIGPKRIITVPPTSAEEIEVYHYGRDGSRLNSLAVYATPGLKKQVIESQAEKDRRMAWWREARFGMFIHWGLYAQPAGEWRGKNYGGASEWLMNTARIPAADWAPLRDTFNPVKYDPKAWVATAKAAGMKYIVITSKHHEGFALWPSKQGTFNVGNTPYRKDLLKPLAEECRKAGIKLGFYHSILDWQHPDYAPRVSWDLRPEVKTNYARYVKYMKAQLKELLTEYGDVAVLWFDGEWDGTWTHEDGLDLYKYVRGLQPNIIVNNRVDKGRNGMQGFNAAGSFAGDFGTPEQEIPGNGLPGVDWESCMTMNGSWGFHAKDENWKSTEMLIRNLIDCASKGGNYLLNVGPTGQGEIPAASVDRLLGVGAWLKLNGSAVYGTTAGPYVRAPKWGRMTRKGNTLFAHVFDGSTEVVLSGLRTDIRSAKLVSTGASVSVSKRDGEWVLSVPAGSGVRVVALTVAGDVRVETPLAGQAADGSAVFAASDAVPTGRIGYEADKDALGFWTDAEDSVQWEFNVTRTGTYRLSLSYACEPSFAGSVVEVQVGGETKSFTVKSTGSWSAFETVDLGEVSLVTTGRATVRVKAKSMPNGAVMNLRSLRLG